MSIFPKDATYPLVIIPTAIIDHLSEMWQYLQDGTCIHSAPSRIKVRRMLAFGEPGRGESRYVIISSTPRH